MKNIIYIAILSILIFSACEECPEMVLEPCNTINMNTERCGMSVVTCYAREKAQDVAAILDTRLNSSAASGTDWGQSVPMIHPDNWVLDSIGQVFGIAIDIDENIYLASSDIYMYDGNTMGGIVSSNPTRPNGYGPGQIFICRPPMYRAVPFVDLGNTTDPLNGVGNIAYDKKNDQLFATNLEDGKIYRIQRDGTIAETYDPWSADGGAPGIVAQDERAWAVGVNEESGNVKVYFPRITSARGIREIYSVTLNGDAFPPQGSEIVEISNVPGDQLIISDIAFSGDNLNLLVAERGGPHESKTFSYTLSSTWGFFTQYFIGAHASSGKDGENSAGGVDFAFTEVDMNVSEECDEYFWASSNLMVARSNPGADRLYGIQGIDFTGNNSWNSATDASQDTDLFIDFDGDYSTEDKRTIGDVEVIDCVHCGDPCAIDDYDR